MDRYHDEVALLVAQAGPLNGQQWAIKDTVVFGRDETSTIVIPDRQVSRHHARILSTPDGMYLEDLGSKNGTHRNGQPIEDKVLLQDSDVIQIALVQKFVFFSSDATLPLNVTPTQLQQVSAAAEPASRPEESSMILEAPASIYRLLLDKRSHRVWINQPQSADLPALTVEKEVLPPLSISQYLLLEVLYDNAGEVVSREDLVRKIWGQEQSYEISEQALDALVRRLRERLESVDPLFNYIKTVRGHGLRLENPKVR
jgi:FHA domain